LEGFVGRLESAVIAALEQARNERALQPFLKKRPLLVRNALNVWAWNYVEVIPEFKFGDQFRADFLILTADSGAWHAVFVEMKSHRVRPFTKEGLPSRALNIGLRQVDDWERWLTRHEQVFRDSVSRRFERKGVPAFCSRVDHHTMAATEILDPRTHVTFDFKILIGRRHHLSAKDQERRASFSGKEREIVTYDRIVGVARTLDSAGSTKILPAV
jgi:hypothetical protein